MAFDIDSLIEGIRESRRYFLNHLKGVKNDRAFMEMLDKGEISDFGKFNEQERDINKLFSLLDESHEQLCAFLKSKFAGIPLDTEVNSFEGRTIRLGHTVLYSGT